MAYSLQQIWKRNEKEVQLFGHTHPWQGSGWVDSLGLLENMKSWNVILGYIIIIAIIGVYGVIFVFMYTYVTYKENEVEEDEETSVG